MQFTAMISALIATLALSTIVDAQCPKGKSAVCPSGTNPCGFAFAYDNGYYSAYWTVRYYQKQSGSFPEPQQVAYWMANNMNFEASYQTQIYQNAFKAGYTIAMRAMTSRNFNLAFALDLESLRKDMKASQCAAAAKISQLAKQVNHQGYTGAADPATWPCTSTGIFQFEKLYWPVAVCSFLLD